MYDWERKNENKERRGFCNDYNFAFSAGQGRILLPALWDRLKWPPTIGGTQQCQDRSQQHSWTFVPASSSVAKQVKLCGALFISAFWLMVEELCLLCEVPHLTSVQPPTYLSLPRSGQEHALWSLGALSCLLFSWALTAFKSKPKYTTVACMGVFHARWMDKAGWS